jgi:hypothetical protein
MIFPLVIHFLFVSVIFVSCFCPGCGGLRTRDDFYYPVDSAATLAMAGLVSGIIETGLSYNSDISHQKGQTDSRKNKNSWFLARS